MSGLLSSGSFVDLTGHILDNINVVAKILLVYEEYTEMMSVQSSLVKVGFDVLGITTEYTLNENVLLFNPDIVIALGRGGKVTTLGVGRRLREMTRWQGQAILILPPGYKPSPQDFGRVRADMLLEAPVPLPRLVQVVAKLLGMDESLVLDRLNKLAVDHGAGSGEEMAPIPNFNPESDNDAVVIHGDREQPQKNLWTFDIEKTAREKEPDLESLWKELTEDEGAKGATASTKSVAEKEAAMSFELKDREGPSTEGRASDLLTEVRKTETDRVAKYARYTDQIPQFNIHQSLSKVSTRKVQLDISSGWNHEEIETQDKARQEFAKALFKKK